MNTWIASKSNASRRLLLALALTHVATAQNGEAERTDRPSFEIASIKAVAEDAITQCGDLPCANLPPKVVDPQRFRAMTVLDGPIGLIEWAYGVRSFQVVNAPEWLSRQKFEIQATTLASSSEDQMKRMVQTLLEDRFHLRVHRQTKQVPVYALVLGKKSLSLSPSKTAGFNDGRGNIEVRPGRLWGRGITMAMLAMILTDNLERPVIDKTGLSGHYDFNLTYEPGPSGPGFHPIGEAIFVPIQELGLKLESQKDAVEVLVIDTIKRPSAN